MSSLSPAQAVLNAFAADTHGIYLEGDPERLAAALRAVANNSEFADVAAGKTVAMVRVDVIQAIAAELEKL